jgi:hypothetical protein
MTTLEIVLTLCGLAAIAVMLWALHCAPELDDDRDSPDPNR